MKTIKIFLASSDELSEERIHISNLIENLNYRFEPRGIRLQLIKWEFLDASMGIVRKQDEYNRVLKECDICMVLFWQKIGRFTQEELDVAYREQKSGRKPQKIYIFFKKTSQITNELAEFQNAIESSYGHFYNTFETVEKLQLDFLLQLELFQNSFQKGFSMELVDSKIKIDGIDFVDAAQIPFCSNNREYKELIEEISELNEILIETPVNIKLQARREKLLSKKHTMESSLLDTAREISKLNEESSNGRLKTAIELFNNGDCKGANAILSRDLIQAEMLHNIRNLHLGKSIIENSKISIHRNVEELYLKIKTLESLDKEANSEEIYSIYQQIVEVIYGYLNIRQYIHIIKGLLDYLVETKRHSELGREITNLFEKIDIYSLDFNYKIAILNIKAYYLIDKEKYDDAEDTLHDILKYHESLSNDQLAEIYDNLAQIHVHTREFDKAKSEYQKAIAFSNLSSPLIDVISSTTNFAFLMSHVGEQESAIQLLNWTEERLKTITDDSKEFFLEQGRLFNTRGIVFTAQGLKEKALEAFLNAQSYFKKAYEKSAHSIAPHLANCLMNLGEAYCSVLKYESAMKYLNESFKLYNLLEEAEPGFYINDVALCIANIASCFESQDKYQDATLYYLKAKELYESLVDNHSGSDNLALAVVYNNLAYCYAKANESQMAKDFYQKCVDLCNKYNDGIFDKIRSVANDNITKLIQSV